MMRSLAIPLWDWWMASTLLSLCVFYSVESVGVFSQEVNDGTHAAIDAAYILCAVDMSVGVYGPAPRNQRNIRIEINAYTYFSNIYVYNTALYRRYLETELIHIYTHKYIIGLGCIV